MNAKKVLVEEEYLISEGKTVRMLTAGVDLNTGVSYADLWGLVQMYIDSKSGYEYAFAIGSDGWEVGPVDSDTETSVDTGMEETLVSAQYKKTENYHDALGRNTNCDIVEVGSKAFYGNAKKLYVNVPGHKKKLRKKYQKLITKAKTTSKIIAK